MSNDPVDARSVDAASTLRSQLPWRRALHVVVLLILVAAVVPFVVYAVPQVVGAESSFVVLTGSMTPAIAPGDAVIVGAQDPGTIERGDVITYHRGETELPTTHRVIGITETAGGYLYETKGDANEGPDANPVPHQNVVGSVVLTIPYIGYAIQFTNTTYGFIALVVLPFGLLLGTEVWSVVTSARNGDETADSAADPVDAVTTESDQESTDDVTVTMDTITGATVVLAVFVPYSAYVTYQLRTAFTVTVTVGVTMCLLLAIGLRLGGTDDPDAETLEESTVSDAETLEEFDDDEDDSLEDESDDTGPAPIDAQTPSRSTDGSKPDAGTDGRDRDDGDRTDVPTGTGVPKQTLPSLDPNRSSGNSFDWDTIEREIAVEEGDSSVAIGEIDYDDLDWATVESIGETEERSK